MLPANDTTGSTLRASAALNPSDQQKGLAAQSGSRQKKEEIQCQGVRHASNLYQDSYTFRGYGPMLSLPWFSRQQYPYAPSFCSTDSGYWGSPAASSIASTPSYRSPSNRSDYQGHNIQSRQASQRSELSQGSEVSQSSELSQKSESEPAKAETNLPTDLMRMWKAHLNKPTASTLNRYGDTDFSAPEAASSNTISQQDLAMDSSIKHDSAPIVGQHQAPVQSSREYSEKTTVKNHRFDSPRNQDQAEADHSHAISAQSLNTSKESVEHDTAGNLDVLTLSTMELHEIESKLDQVMSLVSDLDDVSSFEDDTESEHDMATYSWVLRDSADSQGDAGSCSSATSSWMPSISSFQSDGSENSTDMTNGSNQAVSPNRNGGNQSSLPSSTSTKRSFRSDERPHDDDGDESSRKSPRQFSGFLTPDSDVSAEKQIPCVVDDCPGKDKHISEVLRNANKHHAFFVCVRCYVSFQNESEYQLHTTVGDQCEPHCVGSQCEPSTFTEFGTMPSNRRHRRTLACPSYKMISNKDRWQYLHHLRYPDRSIREPLLEVGIPHPHGTGRQRMIRKQRVQPYSPILLQRQLADAKNDLQAYRTKRAQEERVRDIELKQQCDRTQRLENIISACAELMSASGILPPYLRKMIEYDAPGALASGHDNQTPMNSNSSGPNASNGSAFSAMPDSSTATTVPGLSNEVPKTTTAIQGTQVTQGRYHSWDQEQYIAEFLSTEGMDTSYSGQNASPEDLLAGNFGGFDAL